MSSKLSKYSGNSDLRIEESWMMHSGSFAVKVAEVTEAIIHATLTTTL